MPDLAFSRLATLTIDVTRPPALVDGKRGDHVSHLTAVPCFPLDPVSPEVVQGFGLQMPIKVKQTFVEGAIDIDEGDIIVPLSGVFSGLTFYVRAVGEWDDWRGDIFRHLIVEEDVTEQ